MFFQVMLDLYFADSHFRWGVNRLVQQLFLPLGNPMLVHHRGGDVNFSGGEKAVTNKHGAVLIDELLTAHLLTVLGFVFLIDLIEHHRERPQLVVVGVFQIPSQMQWTVHNSVIGIRFAVVAQHIVVHQQ